MKILLEKERCVSQRTRLRLTFYRTVKAVKLNFARNKADLLIFSGAEFLIDAIGFKYTHYRLAIVGDR